MFYNDFKVLNGTTQTKNEWVLAVSHPEVLRPAAFFGSFSSRMRSWCHFLNREGKWGLWHTKADMHMLHAHNECRPPFCAHPLNPLHPTRIQQRSQSASRTSAVMLDLKQARGNAYVHVCARFSRSTRIGAFSRVLMHWSIIIVGVCFVGDLKGHFTILPVVIWHFCVIFKCNPQKQIIMGNAHSLTSRTHFWDFCVRACLLFPSHRHTFSTTLLSRSRPVCTITQWKSLAAARCRCMTLPARFSSAPGEICAGDIDVYRIRYYKTPRIQ